MDLDFGIILEGKYSHSQRNMVLYFFGYKTGVPLINIFVVILETLNPILQLNIYGSYYTPGIYAAGYIVFALTFVRSSVRMFVR